MMPCDSVCSVLWRVKQGLSYFMHGVRVRTKTESSRLDFREQKPSPVDSISMNKNRVQQTRFPCTKTESNELDFQAYVDNLSSSAPQNRVIWTRFVRNQICFKTCLTNNIVWVLQLFKKKKLSTGQEVLFLKGSINQFFKIYPFQISKRN